MNALAIANIVVSIIIGIDAAGSFGKKMRSQLYTPALIASVAAAAVSYRFCGEYLVGLYIFVVAFCLFRMAQDIPDAEKNTRRKLDVGAILVLWGYLGRTWRAQLRSSSGHKQLRHCLPALCRTAEMLGWSDSGA